MDQEQILSQDSETAGIQQDETQKEKTYFADYTLKSQRVKKRRSIWIIENEDFLSAK